MIGAIAGDIIGSVYEGNPIKTTDFPLFSRRSRFTDDTVHTVAPAYCILHDEDYTAKLKEYFRYYPHAGYGGMFRVSGEYFRSWDHMDAKGEDDLERDGISIFGDVKFPMAENPFLKKIALVGRYDRYDQNKDVEDDEKTYLIAGVEYEVLEGFNIMPNFQRMKVEGEDAEDSFAVNALFKF